ncbi:YggT family protein [Agrococcus sp. HG114]|uniref:YggT family protein n=1 Tax=Agrococcus sp. HG114 TaxID=2969757 RepID=UPI00215B5234|nr:YggT family protein [Agrococcus sp. HG114]MCR8671187.1 YggT family protein [Agrococcus sp. HG114]
MLVPILAWIVHTAAQIVFYLLFARVVLDIVRQVRRDWKPSGFWLVVSVWILRLTDPPLRFVRRFVKPVRVGGAMLDLAMMVLLLALLLLMAVVGPFRFAQL